jgi:hypothetical protein
MPNISLGLEIKADGISQTVGDIKKAQAAIAAMKKEAANFNAVGKALGITDSEAKKLAQSMGKTAEETLDLVNAMKDLKSLGTDAVTRFQLLGKAAGVSAKEFEKLERSLGSSADELSDFQRLGGTLAGAGIVSSVTGIGQSVFQTGMQFERLKTTLKTLLGESGAAIAFEQIQNFAASTPFQVEEVTQAFISLKQRGIDPTPEALTKIGDIASSQGKSLQQFVEAILDSTTGENERLKEFGINAQSTGDKVTFSFQGVNKTVAKTPEAISAALLAFGELKGVAGGMEAQSKTLTGQLSNLQDNLAKLSTGTYDLVSGPASEVVKFANDFLNGFQALPAPVKNTVLAVTGFTAVLGAAIAAMTAYNLAAKAGIVATAQQSAAMVVNTSVKKLQTLTTFALAAATGKLTAAQLASAAAFAKSAALAGAFVGAAAAVVLVGETFVSTTKAARETEAKVTDVKGALSALDEAQSKSANSAKANAAAQDLQKAALERTRESVGPAQRFLDDFVRKPLSFIGLKTSVETSLKLQKDAFGELAVAASQANARGYEVLQAGAKSTSEEVKAATKAVDVSIAALENSIPIDKEDAAVKEERLKALQELKGKLDAVAKAETDKAKATQAAAQKEAESLKQSREESKTQSQEQFEERNRDRSDQFAEQQRDRTEQFNDLQRNADEKFQAIQENAKEQFQKRLQADQEDYQSKENQSKELFQRQQQSTEDAFQSRQNQAKEAFQLRQNQVQEQFEERIRQRKERTATAFTDAQRKASEAEQLASAKTSSEREKLTAEFNRQARQREAISKLQLADREFNPQEILKMAREVSKANLSTADGAQRVNAAIQAIQAEQQKQQEEADRQTKIAFEKALQDERKGFELAQQVAKKDFEKQQQEGQKAFELEQQQSKKTFQAQQQEEQKAFEVQQQEQDKAYQELKRQLDKTIAESERQIQRSFEDEGRTIQKAFNERERQLDQENAEAVKKILESAKSSGGVAVEARRSGGPVAPGEPYLVGEDGPELIIPRAPGQVMTARETAAMMRVGSPSISVNPSIRSDGQTQKLLEQQIELLRYQNDHLRALASRRPAGTVNQTTVVNEYNTRSSRGLPR